MESRPVPVSHHVPHLPDGTRRFSCGPHGIMDALPIEKTDSLVAALVVARYRPGHTPVKPFAAPGQSYDLALIPSIHTPFAGAR